MEILNLSHALFQNNVLPFLCENEAVYMQHPSCVFDMDGLSREQVLHVRRFTRHDVSRVRPCLFYALKTKDVELLKELEFNRDDLCNLPKITDLPRTSLEALQCFSVILDDLDLWKTQRDRFISASCVDSTEIFKWCDQKRIPLQDWKSMYEIAMCEGDIDFLDTLHTNEGSSRYYCQIFLRDAITNLHFNVLQWLILHRLNKPLEILLELMVRCKDDEFLKRFVVQNEITAYTLYFVGQMSLNVIIWLIDERQCILSANALDSLIRGHRYDDTFHLLQRYQLSTNEIQYSYFMRHEFHKSAMLFEICPRFRAFIQHPKVYESITSLEDWQWVQSHGGAPPPTITLFHSRVPITSYLITHDDFTKMIACEPKTDDTIRFLLEKVNDCLIRREADSDAFEWIVDYLLNRTHTTFEHVFPSEFSFHVIDDVNYNRPLFVKLAKLYRRYESRRYVFTETQHWQLLRKPMKEFQGIVELADFMNPKSVQFLLFHTKDPKQIKPRLDAWHSLFPLTSARSELYVDILRYLYQAETLSKRNLRFLQFHKAVFRRFPFIERKFTIKLCERKNF